jgi:hypothetical protein
MKLPPSKGLGIPQECVLERRVRGVLLGVSSWCDCALCAVSSDAARCGDCFCSQVRMRAGNAFSPAPSSTFLRSFSSIAGVLDSMRVVDFANSFIRIQRGLKRKLHYRLFYARCFISHALRRTRSVRCDKRILGMRLSNKTVAAEVSEYLAPV